jgi:YVTN family beta-propeller protein
MISKPKHIVSTSLALLLSLTALPTFLHAEPFAYVPNEGAGTVSVIDTATDKVVAELPGGSKPRGLAVGIDRHWLYVSDQPHNRLQLVDIGGGALGATVALGESPEGVSISPDAVEGKNDIAVIDTRTNALAFSIKVHGKNPEHAVFSPNGRLLVVSAEEGEAVDIIDFAARKQVAQVAVGARPRGIGFLPDSSRAYVATENANEVFVIDTERFAIVTRIKAGLRANGIAVHPSGKQVYVSNGGDANVSVIDTASNQVVATIPVGQRPWNMALTPDGKKLYVANGRSNSVSVIDTANRVKLRDIPVGKLPWGVVIR